MESIFLTTKDGVKIAANLYEVKPLKIEGWLVLTHMMPATKKSFHQLAEEFQNIGYESIAIDLRGHGESDKGPESILDLEIAVDYLVKIEERSRIKFLLLALLLARICRFNILVNIQNSKPQFYYRRLNYRGIKTEPMVKNLKAGQKVFFVSARDDGDNAEENQKLYDLTPANVIKKIKIYDFGVPRNGHFGKSLRTNRFN